MLAALPAVTSVRLEAPERDVERLLRYVGIAPGDELRPERVRDAVQRLYATGEFEDVVVSVREDASGAQLVFRFVPAPRLAAVRVEGASVISPKAVRRAARFQSGEPLWPPRLDAAAAQVALALVRKGYLEARVEARAERRPGGTDAVFQLASGPLVRVSRASIEGTSGGLALLLEPLIRPRAGKAFERAVAQAAAERMRARLAQGGRWRAAVEVREAYDPAAGRVALSFVVTPGPWMRVDFRGDAAPAKARRAVETLLREGGASLDAREAGAERLEETLVARGHRNASATHRVEPLPGGERIVYDVDAGPAWRCAALRFAGGSPSALVKTRVGEPVRDALLDDDVRALVGALEADGHFEARAEADVPDTGGDVPVTFRLAPGPRCLVESFSVETPPEASETGAALPRELRTRAGRPYRIRDVALDRHALLLAWRNAGYLSAEVAPEVSLSDDRGTAVVRLRVTPGERTRVDRIIVRGLRDTREEVVRRELLVEEGGPLGVGDVLESQRRLGALPILERATLVEVESEAAGRRSVLVDTREAPFRTFAYGVGYGDREKLRGSLEVTRRNLFGMDRTLTAFARGSLTSSRFLVSYKEPYLLGRRLELYVTGFREEEDREGFDYVKGGGLVQTLFRIRGGRTLITRYAYQKTDTFNVEVPQDEVDRQFQDATISGPSFSVVQDTRDDPLEPRRGSFVGADLQLSLRALGGDPFLKSYLQAASYRRVLPRTLLAASARLGLARTFGFEEKTRLPLPERFFAGGDFSFRGFPTDGVLEEGGNGLLLGSLELRFDATQRFSLALFSDLGNVYPFASDIDLGDIRASAGVGLRYRTAFGPVRLDWAVKLDRKPEEEASRIHFTVGHAF
ncbi:MAG TPA: BamA/TamA family outer membrane protein [Vicinamibacteria bacterium]|nr:BamA/TamA family outer membrane protein [Vicinamibacteria bacterium]